MKKILFILAIASFVLSISSCGNKKNKTEAGTHKHADGTVHRDDAHSHKSDTPSNQESFEVSVDNNADEQDHDHEHGEHK